MRTPSSTQAEDVEPVIPPPGDHGGDGALVADRLGEGRVDEPEFSLYRRHLRRVDPSAPRWRSDPHSPSGRLATAGDRADVWDEAYLPMSAGTWTRGRLGWAIGSLTKAFACPGL